MKKRLRNLLTIFLLCTLLLSLFSIESPMREELVIPDDHEEYVKLMPRSQNVEILTPNILAQFFPDEHVPIVFKESPARGEEEISIDTSPPITDELAYISTIKQEGITLYYFKNIKTGRLIILNEVCGQDPWRLISVHKDCFILQSEEDIYKVVK